MPLTRDFRVKDSINVGVSALFAAGETAYNSEKVAMDTYGRILSGGRDLASIISGATPSLQSLSNGAGIDTFTFNGGSTATVTVSGVGSLTNGYLIEWSSASGFINSAYTTAALTTSLNAAAANYTTVNSNSARWNSVYTAFNTASGSIVSTVGAVSQGAIVITELDGGSYNVSTGLAPSDSPTFASLLISGDTTVQGSLSVIGSFTYLDTTVSVTSALNITNNGTGPALVANQTGANPVADFQDEGTSVLYIEDGGNIGVGTTNPDAKLSVAGTLSASGGISTGDSITQFSTDKTSSSIADVFIGTLTTAGNPNTVATFPKSSLKTAKYILTLTTGSLRTACEILVIYNNTTAYGTVYSLIDAQDTSLLDDIDVSVAGSTVDLTISVSSNCSAIINGVAQY